MSGIAGEMGSLERVAKREGEDMARAEEQRAVSRYRKR